MIVQSGLVLICLFCGAESGGAASPSITATKPRPPEGDKGVAKLKCAPTPIFALSQCPSTQYVLVRKATQATVFAKSADNQK